MISMNEPLTHRGYTFYQSSYQRHREPKTGRETGRVHLGLPGRHQPRPRIIYAGCMIVVLGAFVQFYMRAGVFTDGGKREQQKAAARRGSGSRPSRQALPPTPRTGRDRVEETL